MSDTGYSVHRVDCPYEHGGACACPRDVYPITELSLDDTLTGAANLLDHIKREWGAEWSNSDQSVRNSITTHLKQLSVPPKAEGVETQKSVALKFDGQEREAIWLEGDLSHVLKIAGHDVVISADALRRLAELAPSVGRGNTANPPPGNPEPASIIWGPLQISVEPERGEPCKNVTGQSVMSNEAASHVPSVAAAAEDVAPWDYKHVRDIILRGHSDLSLELEERNPHFSGSCEAKSVHGYDILAYDHNLCVSRLRERADRFEKLSKVQHEWGCEGKQFTHIDNVVRLQEQIKTLKNEIAMRKAANWTVSEEEIFQKANETNFTLIARAEEAEAKLAKIISEKS